MKFRIIGNGYYIVCRLEEISDVKEILIKFDIDVERIRMKNNEYFIEIREEDYYDDSLQSKYKCYFD